MTGCAQAIVCPEIAPSKKHSLNPVYWLALGTFAVGTEGFMIAGLLPTIASSLAIKTSQAGLLVTIFSLAYAISSPLLTTALAAVNRRHLLIASLGAFSVANGVAAYSHNFWTLAGARVLLALAAGLYVPGANALASAIATPERRGRALAIVNSGITLAVAIGVPLGALVGNRLGWRATFVAVAILSALATIALKSGLPQGIGSGLKTPTWGERLDLIRQPSILRALSTTAVWAIGAYTLYTYLSPFLQHTTALSATGISAMLFVLGASAFGGVTIGGRMSDRFGPGAVTPRALATLTLIFVILSLFAHFLPSRLAVLPIAIAIIGWGLSGWSFFPAQQASLIGLSGINVAPVALSLNASFMYVGFSIGAAIGSMTLTSAGVANLGFVAAVFELVALGMTLLSIRQSARSARPVTS